MRHRRAALAAAAAGLIALGMHHPTADIRLLTHKPADPSPVRFQAALDFGLVAVSVLYTWSRELR